MSPLRSRFPTRLTALIVAVPIVAIAALMLLGWGRHGASAGEFSTPTATLEATATATPQGPKPACPVEPNLPFPDAGCTQFVAQLSFVVKHPELGSLDCSGLGDVSIQRGALFLQEDGLLAFSFNIFFGKLASTCQPGDLSETMHLKAGAEGYCEQRGEGEPAIDCAVTTAANIDSETLGDFSLELPIDCFDVAPDVPVSCDSPEPSSLPEGAELNALRVVLTPLGVNPRLNKLPALANLWLCNQGGVGCANKESGVEEANFAIALDRRLTSVSAKGEPQTLGSFEFEVRYDAKYVSVAVSPGELLDRTGVDCQSNPIENAVQFRCVTDGKPADAPVGPGTLAVVHVTPTADDYSLLIANQGNGIATQLINQGCNLSDLQGHPIKVDVCGDAAVTIRYLEGDIHADCEVDVLDQQQIAFRWGSRLGNLLYNGRYDLEPSSPKKGDGDIDAKDLQFVFGRHGSTCKAPHPGQPPVDPKAKPATPTPTPF